MQVPVGGRRLCGCGSWLSGDDTSAPTVSPVNEPAPVMEAAPAEQNWPKIEGDLSAIERLNDGYRRIRKELAKQVVGQENVLEELLISVFARGHCLLVGVPGLAKTLMIRALADSLSLSFSRIQFTPDLMPSDITGTELIALDTDSGQRDFIFVKGPIFHNVVLADEVNRTPPKTQAALIEAMEEHQVTCGGKRHRLGKPFFVLATQNPIEQEGTYPLPLAQLDRFMLNIKIGYPTYEEEKQIMLYTTSAYESELTPQLNQKDVLELLDIVHSVVIPEPVLRYAGALVRATRVKGAHSTTATAYVREYVQWGSGPRAGTCLLKGGQARAMLHGRTEVAVDDIQALLHPVLRHRLLMNYHAESEGVTPDHVCDRLLAEIPAPEGYTIAGQRSRSRQLARV